MLPIYLGSMELTLVVAVTPSDSCLNSLTTWQCEHWNSVVRSRREHWKMCKYTGWLFWDLLITCVPKKNICRKFLYLKKSTDSPFVVVRIPSQMKNLKREPSLILLTKSIFKIGPVLCKRISDYARWTTTRSPAPMECDKNFALSDLPRRTSQNHASKSLTSSRCNIPKYANSEEQPVDLGW